VYDSSMIMNMGLLWTRTEYQIGVLEVRLGIRVSLMNESYCNESIGSLMYQGWSGGGLSVYRS
jgi:hypothetical protein